MVHVCSCLTTVSSSESEYPQSCSHSYLVDGVGSTAFFDRAAAVVTLRLAVVVFVAAVFVVVVACWCGLLYCLSPSSAKSYRSAGMPAVERCDLGCAVDVVVVVVVAVLLPDRSLCRFSAADSNLPFLRELAVFLPVREVDAWGRCCVR